METKQVIVWRQDLKCPLGKKMAQAAHASHLFLTDLIKNKLEPSEIIKNWIFGNYRKIVVFVRSEEELMEIYNAAKNLELITNLVIDSGLTVFDKPTVTCLSIGPDISDKIDQVTGKLQLL